jgi:2-iminobutanoate/2-iminopropanoate deaminase
MKGDTVVSEAPHGSAKKHLRLDPRAPFSHGVVAGNTLYLSGRIGVDPETNEIPNDIENEVHFLMRDVKQILEAGQMTIDDLVYVQVFCPDVSLWERFNVVYRQYFKGDPPARAFIGSGKLLFNANFEVQAIAVKLD